MDGDSNLLPSSGDVAAAATVTVEELHGGDGGGGSNNSGEELSDKGFIEEGDKSCGGNRWPRQETLALLKIRSDMDAVFRDATHKAPLWEEVSRKLGELGYNRSSKKCKEKFENVYKYHKRTKEVRCGKSSSSSDQNSKKVYRFSDELQAFDNHHRHQISFESEMIPQKSTMPKNSNPQKIISTVPSPIINPTKSSQINTNSSTFPPPPNSSVNNNNKPIPKLPINMISSNVILSSSTSSSTASDDDDNDPIRSQRRRKSKRKWSDFFVKLTKEVIEKQEGLQLKFLEALERIENQRKLRDEAWRIKEMSRVNKEHELLVQERSIAAAKDAAVVAFLHKITPQPITTTYSPPPPPSLPLSLSLPTMVNFDKTSKNVNENGNGIAIGGISPSRWPKDEVEALIRLRTELELKYQDNGSKGPLWEEISSAMKKIGFNRSSKRCKEKWENINKYFKKVKDSNKKRPEDSKTCPYFHQLNALYKEREKFSFDINNHNNQMDEPLMVEPEQQWPPPTLQERQDRHEEDDDDDDGGNSSTEDNDDDDDDEEGDEENGGNGSRFEMVTNKQTPIRA